MNETNKIELYKAALELYKHEDKLNWNKVSMLLSANSLLFIGLGLVKESYNELKIILSSAGAIISFCFFVTIFFGVKYLQHRKEKVEVIEKEIYSDDNIRIFQNNKKFLKVSPTTLVLISLPMIFLIFWILVLYLSCVDFGCFH